MTQDMVVDGVLRTWAPHVGWTPRYCTLERLERPTRCCNFPAVGRNAAGYPRCGKHLHGINDKEQS